MQASGTLDHPAFGPVRYEITEVPESGDGQTSAVIGLMSRYAREDAASPEIQRDVMELRHQYSGYDPVEATFWWVKNRIRFVPDEQTVLPWQSRTSTPVVEALIRPRDMSGLCGAGNCTRSGDCDDFSMYTASLLIAQGIDAKFVTVAASPLGNDYSHVYVAAYHNGQRIPLDTSHGSAPGWETENAKRRREWPVGGAPWVGILLLIGAIAICRSL